MRHQVIRQNSLIIYVKKGQDTNIYVSYPYISSQVKFDSVAFVLHGTPIAARWHDETSLRRLGAPEMPSKPPASPSLYLCTSIIS